MISFCVPIEIAGRPDDPIYRSSPHDEGQIVFKGIFVVDEAFVVREENYLHSIRGTSGYDQPQRVMTVLLRTGLGILEICDQSPNTVQPFGR